MTPNERGRRAETALRAILQARGYIVIRSAASKCLDLIVVPWGPHFPIALEVKATNDAAVYISRNARTAQQHEELCRINDGTLLRCCYAVRFADGHYELYRPSCTVLREHCGDGLDKMFPIRGEDCTVPPIIPPIVPPENDAQADEVRVVLHYTEYDRTPDAPSVSDDEPLPDYDT